MPLLKDVADRLSNNMLIQGVIEEIITEDELFSLLDFRGVNGKALVYNRELALPTADFLAPNDTVSEDAGTVEEVTSYLRAIIGDVDVDQFINLTESDTNDQLALQIAMKVKTVGRKYRNTLINGGAFTGTVTSGNPAGFITAVVEVSDANGTGVGTIELDVSETSMRYTAPGDSAAGEWVDFGVTDGNYTLYSAQQSRYVTVTVDASELGVADVEIEVTSAATKEFTGLKALVTPGQTVEAGTNGGALSFALLDQLFDLVKAGQVDALLMNERTIRAYKALLRTAGGVDSAMLQLPAFGRPVLTFNGVPVLKNNYISTAEAQGTEAAATSVYAVHIGTTGVQGLYGGPNAGIQIEDVGVVQNKDAVRTRVKWYCGLAAYSTLSIARLKGVNN